MHNSGSNLCLRKWPAVLVSAVVVAVSASSSMAGHDPVCNAVTIVLTELQTLEFGSNAGDGTSTGTVIVTPTGAKTVTGGVFDFGGSPSEASWRINAKKQCNVILTLPVSSTVMSGGDNTTVDTFTRSTNSTNPITIPNSSKITIKIGATLQVGTGQAAGTYSGTYLISVNYD